MPFSCVSVLHRRIKRRAYKTEGNIALLRLSPCKEMRRIALTTEGTFVLLLTDLSKVVQKEVAIKAYVTVVPTLSS